MSINWDLATNATNEFDYINVIPAQQNQLDIEPIRLQLAEYEGLLDELYKEAEQITVNDEPASIKATELGVQLRQISSRVNEARTFFKRPALEFGKSIDSLAKRYTTKADSAASILAVKVGKYQAIKKKEELERLQKEQSAVRKLQAQLDKEADKAGIEAPVVPVPKYALPSNIVRTNAGKASVVERLVCKIVDPDLVPREFCEPKQSLLNEALKRGIKNIPGCVIEVEAKARFSA